MEAGPVSKLSTNLELFTKYFEIFKYFSSDRNVIDKYYILILQGRVPLCQFLDRTGKVECRLTQICREPIPDQPQMQSENHSFTLWSTENIFKILHNL